MTSLWLITTAAATTQQSTTIAKPSSEMLSTIFAQLIWTDFPLEFSKLLPEE